MHFEKLHMTTNGACPLCTGLSLCKTAPAPGGAVTPLCIDFSFHRAATTPVPCTDIAL